MRVLPAVRVCAVVAVLVAGAVVAPAQAAPSADPAAHLCASTPFRSAPSRHVWYRIPAIVRTEAGTLLAFAERRDSVDATSDTGDTDVVLARSTDAGCRWSTPRVVAAHGTDTVGNPSPVVDRDAGQVLLLTVDRPRGGTSARGLHLQRSADDGRSFTRYDDGVLDLRRVAGWSGGLTGPGHALQLSSGAHAGRIVVPMGYVRNGRHGAYGILSDDHGATWRVGYDEIGTDRRQEGTVAQLADGRVWVSYHEQSPATKVGTGRIAALSSDGGASLSAPFARLALPTVSVQAASLVLTGSRAGTLLVSSPGTEDSAVRRVMTIFVAKGGVPGSSWHRYPVTLDDTPASYSDLVQVDDATVGVLYETGRTSWHEGIAFRSVRIAALTAGASARATATVGLTGPVRAGGPVAVSVRVRVAGTRSPAGSVRVVLRSARWSRAVTLPLHYPGHGTRIARFLHVPSGAYTVTAAYSGTPRIRAVTVRKRLRVR